MKNSDFICNHCHDVVPLKRNCKGMFCSNQCQQDYQYKSFIERWLAGLELGTTSTGTSEHIRRYLFDKQQGACHCCGLSHWMDAPICLELDHRDGDSLNNVESNVRLLCATCHALTPTYKGRNRGAGRLSRAKKVLGVA